MSPRSSCPKCANPIRWYDNFPLLSWLALGAKCRDCKSAISWRYPAVEFFFAIWLILCSDYLYFVWQYHLYYDFLRPRPGDEITSVLLVISAAILGFLLIGLIVMDWETGLLPDAFTLTGIAIGFFLVCVQAIFLGPGEDAITLGENHITLRSPGSGHDTGNVFLTGPEALIGGRLLAIIGAAAILLAIRFLYKKFRKQDGMGLGDVKMLAMIAAFLGFWPAILSLFAGVILASLYALTLLARRRATTATALPFGSFLGLGGLIAALFGPGIIAWYSGLLH